LETRRLLVVDSVHQKTNANSVLLFQISSHFIIRLIEIRPHNNTGGILEWKCLATKYWRHSTYN